MRRFYRFLSFLIIVGILLSSTTSALRALHSALFFSSTSLATVQAAETESIALTELKLAKQVVQASEVQDIRATLTGTEAQLPTTISIIFRDISEVRYLDQKLEVTLRLSDSSANSGTYTGQVAFPEKISRTKALTAISWRYLSRDGGEYTLPLESISGAWFFVPIKAADPGYEATTTTLQYTPVSGYSLRRPNAPSILSAIECEVQPNGSVQVSAIGKNIDATELILTWANGSSSETMRLNCIADDPEHWQGTLYPTAPQKGRYRLTRIVDTANGERLRNYPDTYFTLQAVRNQAPKVKLENLSISLIPYRLQGKAQLSGELDNVSRVWFYWTMTSHDGKSYPSSALTEAERVNENFNLWECIFQPASSNAGTWSITGVRVDYRDGWQVMFEDDEDVAEDERMCNSVSYSGEDRPVDLPKLTRRYHVGEGQLLTFDFAEHEEVWTWGDVWLEYQTRSESWVYDAVKRQIIVYHPALDDGYYIRVHRSNETSVQNVFLYYPGDSER